MVVQLGLFSKKTYRADIDYLISRYIREFDISKANINILLYKGLIDQSQYEYYYNLPKIAREILIGKLQKADQTINKELNSGFEELMRLFFETNDIKPYEVLSIKKDAAYLIDKIPSVTQFKNIVFLNKNTYTSFYFVNGMEYYYYGSVMDNSERIDIKGMNDISLALHKDYMLDFILTLFWSAQTEPIENVIEMLQLFYNDYINFNLPVGYYRNFNSLSKYDYSISSNVSRYQSDMVKESDKKMLNIYFNAGLLQSLYKIYMSVYFRTHNRG